MAKISKIDQIGRTNIYPFPSKAAAAEGAGRPAPTSAADSTFIAGSPVRARAARPRVVANKKGIENLSKSKFLMRLGNV